MVGVDATLRVSGVEGDELRAYQLAIDGGHGGEPAGVLGDRKDGADRLDDATGREVGKGAADGGDQGVVGEEGADLGFIDKNLVLVRGSESGHWSGYVRLSAIDMGAEYN
jgi:hypothetical protein